MKLHTVPALQGFVWVRRGFQVFLGQPLATTFLLASFLFGALLLLLIPGIGVLLLLMALPLVSLGFMIASRNSLDGQRAGPKVFVEGLQGPPSQRKTMLYLLSAYAAANIVVMLLSDVIDAGRLEALQTAATSDKPMSAEALNAMLGDPRLFWAMVLRLALTAVIALPFWHAPALVHWQGQGVAQALFISSLACWRNKGAFVVYGLGWLVLILLFSFIANALVALLGEPRLLALAAMPAGLMFSTAFYASLYFTYADSFRPDQPVGHDEAVLLDSDRPSGN
ncbi:BPSS1780 family membrane protein [Piscinibacter sakaiensis]|uniref:BPSS1780 family membrane protein n=1 Tax=Piscinibacter sakaiensis TaxID=1547922 RepID=UPI003AAE8527